MNKDDSRIIFISLSIVCFILLYATVAFYVMEESEKGKKIVLQKKYEELTTVKQDLEAKLKESEMLSVELKTRLKTQEDTIAATTKALGEEKAASDSNMLKLQERESEIHGIKANLENEKAEKESILKKIETVRLIIT